MTTSLKDAGGKTLTSQSSGNDDTFWKAAMAAAAVTGAGVYGAQAGIGGAGTGGFSAGAVDSAALGLDGAAGFGGAAEAGTGSMFANEGAAQLAQSLATNPLTQAAVNSAALGPTGSLLSSIPAWSPTSFDALRAAEKAMMGQAAGNIPSTVNMGSLGGTMATSGGLTGAADLASQKLLDATASDQIGGTAASQLGQAAAGGLGTAASVGGDVASFLKGNPTLGRLLFGGALAALNTTGNSNGGAPGESGGGSYGAPAQWTAPASALNAGLLGANQKQVLPPAMTGLLGNANSGAWRWGK